MDDALRELASDAPVLVVAVSGGADSVAAARLLAPGDRRLVVAHFDHRLRPESGADAAFVAELAARLGLAFRSKSADVGAVAAARGWNVEDAARRLRYAFLHRVLAESGGRGAIVVAHTADDQAETLLLQLLRGAAFPAGMPARRGAVVRPLLGARRAELHAYLGSIGQAWREDATNLDVSRNRAWVRHELLPGLERRFPGAAERLARTAGQLAAAREALEEDALRRFGEGDIGVEVLAAAPAAVRRAAVAWRLRRLGVQASAESVGAIERAVLAAPARPVPWRRDLPRGAVASVAYGKLSIGRRPRRSPVPEPSRPVTTPADLPEGMAASVLEGRPGLVIRHRRPGDRIRLRGGRKLVSDLLVDLKVPRAERDALRVLADGSEVLWVEGVAVAEGAGRIEPEADVRFMRLALEQARMGMEAGEVAVGAVVVMGDEVVAAAHNATSATSDPTAHAEVLALRAAARAFGDWRLAGATLFVTLEPCPMCMGAVLQTHLGRVVYGARNLRDGALGGVTDITAAPWKRVPEVRGGVEAAAAGRLLSEAFAAVRDAAAVGGNADDPRQDGKK